MCWLQSSAVGGLQSLMHCHVKPTDRMRITAYGDNWCSSTQYALAMANNLQLSEDQSDLGPMVARRIQRNFLDS
jgi:hypothetical protein